MTPRERRARNLAQARRLIAMPEFWSSFGAILWSKWVLIEPARLIDRPPFRVLATAFPAATLEYIAVVIGFCQFLAVVHNRRWPRVATAFAAAVFWLGLAHGLWLAERSSPSVAVYITIGAQDLALMLLLCCPRRAP